VMAGAIVMVVVLVVIFPVLVMMSGAVLAAFLGGFLNAESDAVNTDNDAPNEYLQIARNEAEIHYPQP